MQVFFLTARLLGNLCADYIRLFHYFRVKHGKQGYLTPLASVIIFHSIHKQVQMLKARYFPRHWQYLSKSSLRSRINLFICIMRGVLFISNSGATEPRTRPKFKLTAKNEREKIFFSLPLLVLFCTVNFETAMLAIHRN